MSLRKLEGQSKWCLIKCICSVVKFFYISCPLIREGKVMEINRKYGKYVRLVDETIQMLIFYITIGAMLTQDLMFCVHSREIAQ